MGLTGDGLGSDDSDGFTLLRTPETLQVQDKLASTMLHCFMVLCTIVCFVAWRCGVVSTMVTPRRRFRLQRGGMVGFGPAAATWRLARRRCGIREPDLDTDSRVPRSRRGP